MEQAGGASAQVAPVRSRPIDRLIGTYALLSAVALLFPHRPPWAFVLLAAHLAVAWLLWSPPARVVNALVARWPKGSRAAANLAPLLVVPVAYTEASVLNQSVHGGSYFDDLVIGWEAVLFGGQPSQTLANALPFVALSELLHAAYLSYYFVVFGPPLILFATGRLEAYHRTIFAVLLTFLACCVVFVFFPVVGPRYLFPLPNEDLARGPILRLTRAILEGGSSAGTAFPSSHVAVAVAQTLMAARFLPRLFPVILTLTIGLWVGTVYGGFHYAIDGLVGMLLAVVLVALAPRLMALLSPRPLPAQAPAPLPKNVTPLRPRRARS